MIDFRGGSYDGILRTKYRLSSLNKTFKVVHECSMKLKGPRNGNAPTADGADAATAGGGTYGRAGLQSGGLGSYQFGECCDNKPGE